MNNTRSTVLRELSRERLAELLQNMKGRRAVLLGDMCLDVYWFADMTRSTLSRETPHFPLPVVSERTSAGAGGNAAVNLSFLCDNVTPVGVIGQDWRGICLSDALNARGLDTSFLVRSDKVITNAYCKPMRRGYLGFDVEDPRLDFENYQPLPDELEDRLLEKLDRACEGADLLCVSDQFEYGCISGRVRERINELAMGGLLTVVDSRSRIGLYRGCFLKPNEIECARAVSRFDVDISMDVNDDSSVERVARILTEKTCGNACVTLGDKGCLIIKDGVTTRIGAIKVAPPIDTVGAGDCFLSAFSLALSAGATAAEAGTIGTLASAVTVKKINTTGSASPSEIFEVFDREANV